MWTICLPAHPCARSKPYSVAAPGVLKRSQATGHMTQAFVEVLASNETFSAPMDATYALLDIEPGSVTTLDSYLQVKTLHALWYMVVAVKSPHAQLAMLSCMHPISPAYSRQQNACLKRISCAARYACLQVQLASMVRAASF